MTTRLVVVYTYENRLAFAFLELQPLVVRRASRDMIVHTLVHVKVSRICLRTLRLSETVCSVLLIYFVGMFVVNFLF